MGTGKCPICISELNDTKSHFICVKCNQSYHKKCIIGWFENKINCPSCRIEYEKKDLIKIQIDIEENKIIKNRNAVVISYCNPQYLICLSVLLVSIVLLLIFYSIL